MSVFAFEICGLPILLATASQSLLAIYADYFRYYCAAASPNTPSLKISLKLLPALPAPETLRPATAEFLAASGPVSFWRGQARGREQFFFQTNLTCFRVEPARGRAIGLISAAALNSPHILANTYTFIVLLLLLRAQGRYHLHTAAVVSPAEVLHLICGAQRAGKSTLTAALGVAGWQAIADDGILLQATAQGQVEAYAFRRDFHLAAELLRNWPELRAAVSRHNYFDRACIDGLAFFQTERLAQLPFSHGPRVIFPHLTGEPESWLEPLPPGEAMQRLIEQSQFFPLWPTHTQEQMRLLAVLVKNATFLRLHAGTDLWHNPHFAATLLAA